MLASYLGLISERLSMAYSLPARRAAENIVIDQYPQNCSNANAQSTLEDPESLQRFNLDASTQRALLRMDAYNAPHTLLLFPRHIQWIASAAKAA